MASGTSSKKIIPYLCMVMGWNYNLGCILELTIFLNFPNIFTWTPNYKHLSATVGLLHWSHFMPILLLSDFVVSHSLTHTHTRECLNIVLVSCLIKCHNLLCGILRDLQQELWIVLIMLAKNFKCQIHLVSYLYNPIILLYGLYHLLVKIWTITES